MIRLDTPEDYLELMELLRRQPIPVSRMTPIAEWPFPTSDLGD